CSRTKTAGPATPETAAAAACSRTKTTTAAARSAATAAAGSATTETTAPALGFLGCSARRPLTKGGRSKFRREELEPWLEDRQARSTKMSPTIISVVDPVHVGASATSKVIPRLGCRLSKASGRPKQQGTDP